MHRCSQHTLCCSPTPKPVRKTTGGELVRATRWHLHESASNSFGNPPGRRASQPYSKRTSNRNSRTAAGVLAAGVLRE